MRSRRPKETYERLLGHLQETRENKRTWFALPGEVSLWWRERSWMKVARRGSGWEVLGAGSERARVAFARLDAGRIAYRLSVLALLVLNGATADAATDSSTGASEAFSLPLFAVLAAVCFCLRAEGPVARTVRRTARAVLSKARRWLESKRAALSNNHLGGTQFAIAVTVVLAVAARCFR